MSPMPELSNAKKWTIAGVLVAGVPVMILVGQLIFGAGASTSSYATQTQVEAKHKAIWKEQRALRLRLRQLEIQGGQRGVEIKGINRKLDGLDKKLDRLLFHFQIQLRPGRGRRSAR